MRQRIALVIRLYAPALVLFFWAGLLAVTHCEGSLFAASALASLASVSLWAVETCRRFRDHA